MQHAFDKLAHRLPLDGVKPIRFKTPPASLDTHLSSFFTKEAMHDALAQVPKVFAVCAKRDHVWPADAMLVLALDLQKVWSPERFSLSMNQFSLGPCDSEPWTSKDDARDAVSITVAMCHVALTLAWLHTKLFSEREQCTRDFRLKAEIENAITFTQHTAYRQLEMLRAGHYGCVERLCSREWKVPIQACREWFEGVRDVLPRLCKLVVSKCVDVSSDLALQVEKHTPSYAHIVNDDRCSLTLAKKHLLGWAFRDVLGEEVVHLFNLLSEIARLHAQWTLSPPLDCDEELKDAIAMSKSVFEIARAALAAIAAVNVLCEMTGKEKQHHRELLLQKTRGQLPKSLVNHLEKATKT